MEKILLAIDAQNLHMSSVDFACYLARLTHSGLTGVFLENLLYEERPLAPVGFGIPSPAIGGMYTEPPVNNSGVTEENIRLFRDACISRCILPKVHRDRGVPTREIIEESRFSDLTIVDAETSFRSGYEKVPGRFVRNVLQEAECPVIIAPYTSRPVEEIYFAYDGSRSSVYAIKQFAYLLPELAQKKVTILSVRRDHLDTIEEPYKMKEWLKAHYSPVEYVVLKGDPTDQIFSYLLEKKEGILVMGAYGRNVLSRLFQPSRARLAVRTLDMPIFIAHS